MDITKFQLKRVNAFQGLVIDADTWKDAHNYHRDQQRLHLLAFHKTGIVSGLELTAFNPADSSVSINPGIAIDPDGNLIIVQQKQRYKVQSREKGTVYLVLQFREIPSEPFQPPEGGQPTRILEAYRIQERDKLANEPYVELGRIEFDPGSGVIKDAKNPAKPGLNEINLSFRETALQSGGASPAPIREAQPQSPQAPQVIIQKADKQEAFNIGHAVVGEGDKNLHVEGLKNLARESGRQLNLAANLDTNINLASNLTKYSFIYLTGTGRFELTPEQINSLSSFLQSGGTILGQVCSQPGDPKSTKEFGLAFNRVAGQLNCKLGIAQRGNPLLSGVNVFSEAPPGCEPAMLMEGGRVIYSGSDYGCAWEGGHPSTPLPREIIRNAFEIGINFMAYALSAKIKR
jgi:hypothetical protein